MISTLVKRVLIIRQKKLDNDRDHYPAYTLIYAYISIERHPLDAQFSFVINTNRHIMSATTSILSEW